MRNFRVWIHTSLPLETLATIVEEFRLNHPNLVNPALVVQE